MKAEHWIKRELKKFMVMVRDPMAWIMLAAVLGGGGLILWFLLHAADNFGSYYYASAACAQGFTQMRLFFLSMITPLFFIAVIVFMGEMTMVLGLRKKKHRANYKFLFLSLAAMFLLGGVSFVLLSC